MAVKNEIRQSSVIYSAGPGGMSVLQDGSVVLVPGIDAWYIDRSRDSQRIPQDVAVQDKNLAKELNVDILYQPPAAKISSERNSDSLPAILFPKWVTCYDCGHLQRLESTATQRPNCPTCMAKPKGPKRRLVQVNFVVACEAGHLDEFPWIEWVHRGVQNVCSQPRLTFTAKSAVQLKSQIINCDCGARRNMAGTTDPEKFASGLSPVSEETHLCTRQRPWLRDMEPELCSETPRTVLRNSNNLYFSATSSSILVPTQTVAPAEVLRLIRDNPRSPRYLAKYIQIHDIDKLTQYVFLDDPDYYEGVAENELQQALIDFLDISHPLEADVAPATSEFVARDEEWLALQKEQEDFDLVVRAQNQLPPNAGERGLDRLFSVPKLKVTTALRGFNRIQPKPFDLARGKALLRRNPFAKNANWLPAVQHTGEGIFLTFDESKITAWERQPEVKMRVQIIQDNLLALGKQFPQVELSARFVLLHTFAHLLIHELVLECGYTSAALSERIYAKKEQAGILIYTASSDADGTMGGLVEMSRPDRLVPAIERAISRSTWCSNDPVCMENGTEGQGNFGSNLAACHSCTLLPETACEVFNQGLDRAYLIGDLTGQFEGINFFK